MKKILLLCIVLVLAAGCAEKPPEPYEELIDIDLTGFNATMLYSVIADMFTNPDEYSGKIIKVNGIYDPIFLETTGRIHHDIMVEGPPGCCPKYLELVWDEGEEREYPDEFTAVQVTGAFGIYEEAGRLFAYLAVENLSII
jgi:hypothetical protein